MNGPTIDRAEMIRAAKLLVAPGGITELRALNATLPPSRFPGTVSGYFQSASALSDAVAQIGSASGVYIVLNQLNPDLLARAANRIRTASKSDPLTADNDIQRRRWLPIDLDPTRPTGVSSTDGEHETARARAEAVREYLREASWPEPVLADSGNGFHLLYRVDFPPDDGGLVKRVLEAISAKFTDSAVTLDTSVHNPARIWKLYGTVAAKGDSTASRPHRLSRLVEVPENMQCVALDQLTALAGEPPAPVATPPQAFGGGTFSLDAWIARHLPDAVGPKPGPGGGRLWVLSTCPFRADHTNSSAFIGQHANGALYAGCHHNACTWTWHELRAKYDGSAQSKTRMGPASHGGPISCEPIITKLADVTPRPVNWLWPWCIASGKVTLLVGDPGLGKSFVTLDFAARVSRGFGWPNAPDHRRPPGGVVLLSAEDDAGDTIRPRLDAAGADVSRIVALEAVRVGDSSKHFDLSRDLVALERAIQSVHDCRLVVIDPISSYMGQTDSHCNADVRGVLAPLAALAAKYNVAIVVVSHMNKNSGSAAIYRTTGSLAFVAAARAAWAVVKDKDDPERRLFLPVKNNVGPDRGGLSFALITKASDAPPTVAWDSEPVLMTVDEAMSALAQVKGKPTAREDATVWLREFLASGPKLARDVFAAAFEAQLRDRTVKRAASELGIVKRKEGFSGGWNWALPPDSAPPSSGTEASTTTATEESLPQNSGTLRSNPEENPLFPPKGSTSPDVAPFAEESGPLGRSSSESTAPDESKVAREEGAEWTA